MKRVRDTMSTHRLRSLRTLATGLVVSLMAFSAPAADPASAPPAISDVVLARSALAALDADAPLHDVNLIVSVVNRVAVVGGPVASGDQSRRAETIVRRVPGIVDVKNHCYVPDAPDPLLRAMSERAPSSARRVQATELPGVVASPKSGLVEAQKPAPGNELAAVEPAERSVVARRMTSPGASVLLPPVGLPGLKPPVDPSPAVGPAPVVLTSRPADALTQADAIRKSDARFSGLTVSITNGTLVIAGRAARASDAWDLAHELKKIPVISRVALGVIELR